MKSPTVIRHYRNGNAFIQVIAVGGNCWLQAYQCVARGGRTVIAHSETWSTEEGAIGAFNRLVENYQEVA